MKAFEIWVKSPKQLGFTRGKTNTGQRHIYKQKNPSRKSNKGRK